MRLALSTLALLPAPLLADVIIQPSRATDAVIYPNVGLVTHAVTLDVPAGAHQIVLPDLPPGLPLDSLRLTAPDLRLGSLRYRTDLAPPRGDSDSAEIKAAEDRIDQIEAQIEAVKDDADRQALAARAAQARIDFLTSLGQSDALPGDVDTLRDLSRMVGEEALAASNAALDAELAARKTREALEDLQEELAEAKAALAALVPEEKARPYLVVEASADTPVTNAAFSVTFLADANWQPTYDFRLTDGDRPALVIDRGAQVAQNTGENWQDIRLTLSTQSPSNQLGPSTVPQDYRRLVDPEEMQMRKRALSTARMDSAADPIIEAPVIVEEYAGSVEMQGLAVTYVFDRPVSVATGTDTVRLPFDSQSLDAEIFARAAPFHDETAFLMARFTPDFGQPLLPTGNALHFFDGGLVGGGYFDGLVDGEEAELAFGPIDGLQLTRTVLNRNEGDRGIISRSNELTERARIEVKNLTNRRWSVELRDRVPYSEQEDLKITYSADPAPNVTDVEDRRGILQWSFDLPASSDKTIGFEYRIKWPEGQILR